MWPLCMLNQRPRAYKCILWGEALGFSKSLRAVNPAASDSPAEPAPKLQENLPRARARNSRRISRGTWPETPGRVSRGPGPKTPGGISPTPV